MIKKIILGGLLVILSGALIYGGIHRTSMRLETVPKQANGSKEQISLERTEKSNRTEEQPRGNQSAHGRGQDEDLGRDPLLEQISDLTILGDVREATDDRLVVAADDGREFIIENRAWWFALDSGFSASANDKIEISGFLDENGTFEVIWMLNASLGMEVFIRDESGRPNWAGGNGGSGRLGRS